MLFVFWGMCGFRQNTVFKDVGLGGGNHVMKLNHSENA